MKKILTISIISILIILVYLSFSSDWKLWLYIDNKGQISRIYMGDENSLEKCRFHAMKYISKQQFSGNKYYFYCGNKCSKYETSCTNGYTSRHFDKDKYDLLIEGKNGKYFLKKIQEIYQPEYFTYPGQIKLWFLSKYSYWFGFAALNEKNSELLGKYTTLEYYLLEYQTETLNDELSLELGPTLFKIRLENLLER